VSPEPSLAERCAACGAEHPLGARFCPACGVPTADTTGVASRGERRVVTVLFADLVGFTTLAEERDPEAVKELLDRCFGELVPVVELHGGRVDKIIGDELMAVFGAPLSHEDDPERAVRAAQTLHQALDAIAPELALRIGINAGEVLAGPVGPQQAYTVTGDTVNTAHRLASAAGAGETLVGERVRLATEEVVDYQERPPFELRGKHAPVRAWSAGDLRAPAEAAAPGAVAASPLIGRDTELGHLVALADRAAAAGQPETVVVTGEPGVGKTRLASELVERRRRDHSDERVFWVRCAPYGTGQALEPLAELVRTALGLDASGSPADQRAELARRLEPVAAAAGVDAPVLTARIADLVGIDEVASRPADPSAGPVRLRPGDQLLTAARSVVQAVVGDRPVTVVIDDAHWADDAVLEALERLPYRLGPLPLLVLVLGREELLERRPWRGRKAPDTTLVALPPLAAASSKALLANLLRARHPAGEQGAAAVLGPEAERRILSAAGGNPLLLEQLVGYLVEQGALAVRHDHWQATADLEEMGLPDDSRALISTRLDGLPTGERDVVFAAAVVGPRFWMDVVGELVGAAVAPEVVEALVRRGLLEPLESTADGTDHAFTHTLTREVAYAATAMGDRAAKHALVAAWLERRFPAMPGRVAGHLAQHYERAVVYARQLDRTDPGLSDRAFAAMVRAAEEAARHDALHTADRWFARAREFAGPATERAHDVAFAHGRVLVALRRLEQARQTFDAVRRGAQAQPGLVAAATAWLATTARLQGDLIDARDAFDEAQQRWHALGDVAGEGETLWLQGWSELIVGRARAALPKLRRAVELERGSGPRGVTLQALGWSEYVVGELDDARRHLWQAADRHVDEGDPGGAGWCFGILGFTFLVTGQAELALQTARNLIGLAQVHGESWSEASCLVLLAGGHTLAGDVRPAQLRASEALAAFEEFDSPWGAVMSRLMAARAARLGGDLGVARTTLRDALGICQRVTHVGEEPRLLVELAQVDLDEGLDSDAGRRARSALALTRAGFGDHDSGYRALLVLAELARSADDRAAEQLLLEEVVDGIDHRLPTDAWRQANAALAQVMIERDDLAAAERLVAVAADGAAESVVADVRAERARSALRQAQGQAEAAASGLRELLERHRGRDLPVLAAAADDLAALGGARRPGRGG
jgi:class 3 adenylate cyclase/tetratricopeptide (TPR) repeat protein